MSGGYTPRSVIRGLRPQVVGANAAAQVLTRAFQITPSGSLNIRIDTWSGLTVAAAGLSLDLQTSAGNGEWTTMAKAAVAVGAAAGVAVVPVVATDYWTDTGHGFVGGERVQITAAALPAGVGTAEVYFVKYINANNFQLSLNQDYMPIIDVTTTGTTVKYTRLALDTLTFNIEVSGDQADLPLRPIGRLVIDTGAGDSTTIMDVVVCQED